MKTSTRGEGVRRVRSTAESSMHMTYGINGAKDKISIEMKDRCSIWNVESIYLFVSQSNAYSRKDFVLRPDTHAALHQALGIRLSGILDTKLYV